jgi:hypothetical protein
MFFFFLDVLKPKAYTQQKNIQEEEVFLETRWWLHEQQACGKREEQEKEWRLECDMT